jgi:hypothetical protein
MGFIEKNKWKMIQSILMITLILTYIIVLKNVTYQRYASKETESIGNQTLGNLFISFKNKFNPINILLFIKRINQK